MAKRKRRKPRLSEAERKRRAERARSVLLPAAIKATGRRGFAQTAVKLSDQPGITNALKLAGWLKGQAKKAGVLSTEHAYRGRKRTLPKSLRKALARIK